jgi:hypothetical protein
MQDIAQHAQSMTNARAGSCDAASRAADANKLSTTFVAVFMGVLLEKEYITWLQILLAVS